MSNAGGNFPAVRNKCCKHTLTNLANTFKYAHSTLFDIISRLLFDENS